MFAKRIDELDTSEFTNNIALVCSRYELEQLKYILDEFVKNHGVLQTPYASHFLNTIARYLK